jgi:hypothetical protein
MGNVVKDYFQNSYKSLVSFFAEQNKISAEELKDIIRLHKTAPPPALVTGNVKSMDVGAFDLTTLENEPYFLDGFRQVYGVGRNMMPMKNEVLKVELFTGNLARYYDPTRDKIGWIETRPEPEVFKRPDLASIN